MVGFGQLMFAAVNPVCFCLCFASCCLSPAVLWLLRIDLACCPPPPYGGLATVGPQDPLAKCQIFTLFYSLIQERLGKTEVALGLGSRSLPPSAAWRPFL